MAQLFETARRRSKTSDITPFWWRGKEEQVGGYDFDDFEFWRHLIRKYANGTWPVDRLGPGPWDPDNCVVPRKLFEELQLEQKYPTPDGDRGPH